MSIHRKLYRLASVEFKFSHKSLQVEKMRAEGIQQISTREYSKSYASKRCKYYSVLVAYAQNRKSVY